MLAGGCLQKSQTFTRQHVIQKLCLQIERGGAALPPTPQLVFKAAQADVKRDPTLLDGKLAQQFTWHLEYEARPMAVVAGSRQEVASKNVFQKFTKATEGSMSFNHYASNWGLPPQTFFLRLRKLTSKETRPIIVLAGGRL